MGLALGFRFYPFVTSARRAPATVADGSYRSPNAGLTAGNVEERAAAHRVVRIRAAYFIFTKGRRCDMAENPRESDGYKAKLYEGERVIPATGGIVSEEASAEIIERIRATMGDLTVPDNGYTIGMDVAKTGSDRTALTLKLNVDVSDALTGLKALRREADRAVAALKALEEAARRGIIGSTSEWDRYIAAVREITGKYYRERDINLRVFDAVYNALHNRTNSTIQYERCEGATTSAIAAVKTFESAMLVVPDRVIKEYFTHNLDMPHVCTEEEARRGGLFRGVSVVIFDEGANLVDLPKNACYVRLVSEESE
jgi:hypothetical protein